MDLSNVVAGGVAVVATAAAAAQFLYLQRSKRRWPFRAAAANPLNKCQRCHQEVIPTGSASPVCGPCLSKLAGLPLLGLFSPSPEAPPEVPDKRDTHAMAAPPPRRCPYKRCTRRDMDRLFGGRD